VIANDLYKNHTRGQKTRGVFVSSYIC